MTEVNAATGQVREVVQLHELAKPFPDQFVEEKDHQKYVAHHVVTQRLLSVVGPFDFELVQILRSDVPAVPPDPEAKSRRYKAGLPALHQVVTGAVWRLTCEIDGRRTVVEEAGDADPHNNDTDGGRLKDAASDAIKRCAMRLGLGTHLWAGKMYFLDRQLEAQARPRQADPQPRPLDPADQAARARVEHQARGRFQRQDQPAWEQQDAPV